MQKMQVQTLIGEQRSHTLIPHATQYGQKKRERERRDSAVENVTEGTNKVRV